MKIFKESIAVKIHNFTFWCLLGVTFIGGPVAIALIPGLAGHAWWQSLIVLVCVLPPSLGMGYVLVVMELEE